MLIINVLRYQLTYSTGTCSRGESAKVGQTCKVGQVFISNVLETIKWTKIPNENLSYILS